MPEIVVNLSNKIRDFFSSHESKVKTSAERIATSIMDDSCLKVIKELVSYVVCVGSNQDDVAREAYNLLRELQWVREEITG